MMPFEFHPIEKILLASMIFFFMFGIGAGLHFQDFKRCFQKPRYLILGLSCQYLIMPSLALLVGMVFDLSLGARFVLLLIGCSPGGTSSNMFSFLSRADLSLSVTLTLISSLCAVFVTPLLIRITGQGAGLVIPYKNMFLTLMASLIPILIGMFIKIKKPSWADLTEKWARQGGLIIVLIMIVLWIPKLWGLLTVNDLPIFSAVALMGFAGITIPMILLKLFHIPRPQVLTIGFETGIQNAPLAYAMIGLSFPAGSMVVESSWIALVYGALSIGNGIVVFLFTKLKT